jgi:hypothetical protein
MISAASSSGEGEGKRRSSRRRRKGPSRDSGKGPPDQGNGAHKGHRGAGHVRRQAWRNHSHADQLWDLFRDEGRGQVARRLGG